LDLEAEVVGSEGGGGGASAELDLLGGKMLKAKEVAKLATLPVLLSQIWMEEE